MRVQNEATRQEEPRVLVQSEDDPQRLLLETRVFKEDGFQKQQGTWLSPLQYLHLALPIFTDTLIVWTEPTTTIDMALSFQEAEGCTAIWLEDSYHMRLRRG
jgi:protein phosphatase-4 regulatory subunit 3